MQSRSIVFDVGQHCVTVHVSFSPIGNEYFADYLIIGRCSDCTDDIIKACSGRLASKDVQEKIWKIDARNVVATLMKVTPDEIVESVLVNV